MVENGSGESHHHEALDADAVCAQCSTINPEGTLICRNCGNNLRDQRAVRLQANEQLMMGGPPRQKRKIVAGLLSIMGLLLIVWTVINLEWITDSLINMNSPKAKLIRSFWDGEDKDLYDDMRTELRRDFPDTDVIDQAIEQPVPVGEGGGFFAIVDNNGRYDERDPICANLYIEGETAFFVALSRRSEVRGKGDIRGDSIIVRMNGAAADIRGSRKLAVGIATILEDGVLECDGNIEDSNQRHEFYAVPLP